MTDANGLRELREVVVNVNNVNDAPVVTSKASINVSENTAAVLTAVATDQDKSAITWSISGGADKALFQIDAKTGLLSFKSAPDFEAAKDFGRNNVYDVTIKATDAGGLSDTQAIAVKVTDVNYAPVISSKGTGTIVAVAAENDKTVTTVKGIDPDKQAVTWSISGGADQALFRIDSKTGIVSFKSAPDFEAPKDSGKDNIYDVRIKATDKGGLTDTEWLAVVVTNVNDAPVIGSNGGASGASVNAAENAKVVTTAKAGDSDKDMLTWSISGGADKALFQIDAKTGLLSFKSAPDFEAAKDIGKNNIYDVTIKVTDSRGLSDTQALAVPVADIKGKTLGGTSQPDKLAGTREGDALAGKGGSDALSGGEGKDKLTGGAGADTFVFVSIKDSTVAAKGRDAIFDFDRNDGDQIKLSGIDAKAATAKDDAFSFIGTGDFSKKAGELSTAIRMATAKLTSPSISTIL